MKHRAFLFMLILFLITMVVHLTMTDVVYANPPSIDELEPNQYEKKTVKTNKSLLHDESASTTVRSKIPEHIRELSFEGGTSTNDNHIASLFLNETANRNTIQSKAVEMNLFTATISGMNNQLEEEVTSSSTLSISILIWVLVGICSVALVIVLYIWGVSSSKKQVIK
ncbi:type VII secretion protein EssA [Metabacillus malikii]|uniref:Type VII secretion protein EssA n=1 Tax=Metabacillus malikii TaxID=1504265 RepID=A0ABT9ZGB3_9BACI|nr:type VII secretion protein EssA [Metabacillus malikii]MDQ0230841.1 type VII secretion protein EssA [Metabacillus malikii]